MNTTIDFLALILYKNDIKHYHARMELVELVTALILYKNDIKQGIVDNLSKGAFSVNPL